MGSTAETRQPEARIGTVNEAPEVLHPNAASATETPYGVEGATPRAPDPPAPKTKTPAQGVRSPADEAATTPPLTPEKEPGAEEEPVERVAKKARLDEQRSELRSVIRNLRKMTRALEKASGSLDATYNQIQTNTAEVERLAGQLGLDQANCRWQLATFQTFTNKLAA